MVQPFSPSSISVTTPAFTRVAFSTSGGFFAFGAGHSFQRILAGYERDIGHAWLNDFSRSFTGEVSSRSMCRPALKATI